MVLEGAMIVLATATMTIYHPGPAFSDERCYSKQSYTKQTSREVQPIVSGPWEGSKSGSPSHVGSGWGSGML